MMATCLDKITKKITKQKIIHPLSEGNQQIGTLLVTTADFSFNALLNHIALPQQ